MPVKINFCRVGGLPEFVFFIAMVKLFDVARRSIRTGRITHHSQKIHSSDRAHPIGGLHKIKPRSHRKMCNVTFNLL